MKRFGVTIDCYIDGSGYGENSLSVDCGCDMDSEWRCPFAMTETRPAEEGQRCAAKNYGDCRRLCAQLDALEKAKNLINAKIREVKEEMEAAE